ncbi:LytR C-terminal domain-containing protein [uncultured Microbacterium sp.]|uniref:LytR C-terminal domain-containing protein n=1 Tax=uncultured Microbacterium sp. TaxID=191216 RepID=UPI0026275A08|nr:LytR C-terminal domain-containing protein [uncultured Microbacterium sp.]
MPKPDRDRFDDVPRSPGRVGAHRAEAPGMNGWVVLLWSVVAALVIVVVGIFVSLVLMGRIVLSPEVEPTVAPAPQETGVVDTSYSVLVLNATSEEGLEVQLRDTVINGGWPAEDVSSGSTGAEDFPETTVYYVSEDDALAALGLAELIGGARIEQSDFYADPNDPELKQLVIVVGLDRASSAPQSDEETVE